MQVRVTSLFVAAIIAVAGCAPVSGPQSGAAQADFKSESAKAFVAGFQPAKVSVREKNSEDDIPANCRIESAKFQVAFLAPGKVNLPAYSDGAVPITMTCTVESETYQMQMNPVNLSKRARTNSAVGVGLLCPVCGLGVAAGSAGEKAGDIYGFHKIELEI